MKSKNKKIPWAFYIAFGWVLGCYSSTALYFQYKEFGLFGLCILGTIGLLLGILYFHNKQYIYSANEPEKPKKSLKNRILTGAKEK
ncbi:MAG: hypothetical protein IMZ52_07780 [Actinobacteria bacterium]|nr:hypothetical protein [Actinomycetota bacterium]